MVACSSKSLPIYVRQHKVEENEKKMEDLHLSTLSQTLPSLSPKASQMIEVDEEEVVVVRRSGRITKKPSIDYKEFASGGIIEPKRTRCHHLKKIKEIASDRIIAPGMPTYHHLKIKEKTSDCIIAPVRPRYHHHLKVKKIASDIIAPERPKYHHMKIKEIASDRIIVPKRSSSGRRRRRGLSRRRDLSNRVFASYEARQDAIKRAKKAQSDLPIYYPSIVKGMLKSHVTGGFWMGLPVDFCNEYLPTKDETLILIDEDRREYPIKYLVGKTGLSGGWRGFAIAHNLVDGDALVFQLIQPYIFKVHIVRVNDSEHRRDA